MKNYYLNRKENETIARMMGWQPVDGDFLWDSGISESEFLPRFDVSVYDANRLASRMTELGWGIMPIEIEGKPAVHCIHTEDPRATHPLVASGTTHMEALCQAALILAERLKSL